MDILDRVLTVVVDIQDGVKELKARVGHLEEVQDKTYNKLDGFLVLINRHEAEIAALRSAVARLSDRIERLETARA